MAELNYQQTKATSENVATINAIEPFVLISIVLFWTILICVGISNLACCLLYI